jgi:hypothetical protein
MSPKNFKGKWEKPHWINENIETTLRADPFESSAASGLISQIKPLFSLPRNR